MSVRSLQRDLTFYLDACRCVHRSRKYCSTPKHDNKLLQQLQARIRMNSPITVADYMREVLTNPTAVSPQLQKIKIKRMKMTKIQNIVVTK